MTRAWQTVEAIGFAWARWSWGHDDSRSAIDVSNALHKHRASFETRADARSSGGGKWVMAQRKSPHPEEATKGPSRRTHGSRSRVIANISLPPRSAILEPDSRGLDPAIHEFSLSRRGWPAQGRP